KGSPICPPAVGCVSRMCGTRRPRGLCAARRDLAGDEDGRPVAERARAQAQPLLAPSSRRCERSARHRVFLLVTPAQASIARDCKPAHTPLPICLQEPGTAKSIWRKEANMARKPDRLAFVFAMVIARAMPVLAVKTWAGPPAPDSDSAAPIPPRE